MTNGYRWNRLNTRLVNTAESRALATLEVSVHLDLSEDLPSDRFYVEIEIPDKIEILEVRLDDLPHGWDSKPPSYTTQIIGDDFVFNNNAAVLKVPSCIIPEEYNYLINPNHVEAKRIRVKKTSKMKFDERFNPIKE